MFKICDGVILRSRIMKTKSGSSLDVFLLQEITFLCVETHRFRIIEKDVWNENNPSWGLVNSTLLLISKSGVDFDSFNYDLNQLCLLESIRITRSTFYNYRKEKYGGQYWRRNKVYLSKRELTDIRIFKHWERNMKRRSIATPGPNRLVNPIKSV